MSYTPATSIAIKNNSIYFGRGLRVQFQRTLRIPDDGKTYPLPPGFGAFPVRRVDDYLDRVPEEWRDRGGVFLPMYQREAMWLRFQGEHWKPRAVKVGIGKVCAITGERWNESLSKKSGKGAPQNYVVTPPQPWLDGICSGTGTIRQFVAMPLGMGYTVEGQVTGEERFGGIQLKVFEPRPGRFPDQPPPPRRAPMSPPMGGMAGSAPFGPPPPAPMAAARAPSRSRAASMGLAAGGRMTQKIYRDPHGIDTWDHNQTSRVFIHIVNSEMFREITGEQPPATPITAREYANNGLPWFDLYDESLDAVSATHTLGNVKSVKQMDVDKFGVGLQDDSSVTPGPVTNYPVIVASGLPVRDGNW